MKEKERKLRQIVMLSRNIFECIKSLGSFNIFLQTNTFDENSYLVLTFPQFQLMMCKWLKFPCNHMTYVLQVI